MSPRFRVGSWPFTTFRALPRSIVREQARAALSNGRHQRKALARIARAKARWGIA